MDSHILVALSMTFEDDLKDCRRDHWFAEYFFLSMLVDVIVLHILCNFIVRYEKSSIYRSLGTAHCIIAFRLQRKTHDPT